MRLLSDVRVLDLSLLLPGPGLTAVLAAMGADVLRVERPGSADMLRAAPPTVGTPPQSVFDTALNARKRAVGIDLKTAAGVGLVRRLVTERGYDVVIEGFRPGVLDRLGLGYEALHEAHPGVIVCSLSGYGQHGPLAQRAGHDINYLALSGVLDRLRPGPDAPPVTPGVQIADIAGGSSAGAAAVCAALYRRARTGGGAWIDLSLAVQAGVLHLMTAGALNAARNPHGLDAVLDGRYPCYRVYRCADGEVAVGALEPKFWAALCDALGVPDLTPHAFAAGDAGRAVIERLSAVFASAPRDAWAERLADVDCCVEPVLRADEIADHPRSVLAPWFADEAARGAPVRALHPFPAGGPAAPFTPAPLPGEHTDAVLVDLGLEPGQIRALRERGIVG